TDCQTDRAGQGSQRSHLAHEPRPRNVYRGRNLYHDSAAPADTSGPGFPRGQFRYGIHREIPGEEGNGFVETRLAASQSGAETQQAASLQVNPCCEFPDSTQFSILRGSRTLRGCFRPPSNSPPRAALCCSTGTNTATPG